MNENVKKKVITAVKIIVSLILSTLLTASVLGAVAIGGARDYLESDSFHEQVQTADLNELKFKVNGQTVTVNDYVRQSATKFVEQALKNKYSFASMFTNVAIEAVLSNEIVEKAIKDEVFELVDYFLNSDLDEAKQRMENNISSKDNPELDPSGAKTPEEAVKRYVRSFVIQNIESTTGISSDRIIVLFSEKTVKNFILISVLLSVALIAVNFSNIFNTLIYGGAVSFACGIAIKVAQSKFETANEGATDLVGYVFLKPLADAYSPSAVKAFVAGVILLLIFAGMYFLFKKLNNNETQAQSTEQ
ncbi:MAG: hypothetical protein ACI4N4_01735 [Candidatus Fimenecus sp.]